MSCCLSTTNFQPNNFNHFYILYSKYIPKSDRFVRGKHKIGYTCYINVRILIIIGANLMFHWTFFYVVLFVALLQFNAWQIPLLRNHIVRFSYKKHIFHNMHPPLHMQKSLSMASSSVDLLSSQPSLSQAKQVTPSTPTSPGKFHYDPKRIRNFSIIAHIGNVLLSFSCYFDAVEFHL